MIPRAEEQVGLDWERLQALFQRAITLDVDVREAFIRRETETEPALRVELMALLASDIHKRTGPLSRAVESALVDVIQDQQRSLVGRIVGSYRLASILGQGGSGTVYLGERADSQYSGQVAVKVVDVSALQGGLDARFRAERQILANLNHPNIARLIDAGEMEQGQPYLVMEYVQGEPVDRYCDSRNLGLRQRLELFAQICAAVQYAHQNLIVHRDLKPANILVTPDGVPKLLDFGIAKLLDVGDTTPAQELTRVNDRLLTPEYASPEQILGGTVTTASDVYSLGVVLYQLLSGLRPYRVPTSASQLELERSICISDPDRPSAAVARAAGSNEFPIADIAEARSSSADRLSRQLLGDIDSIVMRALRKEAQHRYSSVEQFAADVQRHLTNEPVQARQGNWLYYGQRFARRHTTGVVASACLLVFVVGIAIVMSIQRQQIAVALERATQDEERAETVSEFMLDVFSAADPYVHAGKEPTARSLLEQAARRIQTDLDQQPAVRARLLEAIGRSYSRMGHADRAAPYLEDSLRIQRDLDRDGTRVASILMELAVAQRETAKYEESDRTFAEALTIVKQSRDTNSLAHAQLLADLGRLELVRSNTEQAQEYLSASLRIMRNLRGPNDPEVGAILAELANVMTWRNDLDQAEQHARAAVKTYARAPETHPDRIMAERTLAQILLYQNRLDESGPLFEHALAGQRLLYGSNNAIVADTLGWLGQLRVAQEKYDAAEQFLREALAIHRASESTIDHQLGHLQTVLGIVLLKKRNYAEAETILRDTLEVFARSLPSDHQYVASAEYHLGEALLAQRHLSDAEAVLTASMNRWKRTDAPAWRAARSRNALGEVLHRQGRKQEAEQILVSTFRELTAEDADRDAKRRARERIERFYQERGELEKLATLMREANEHVARSEK
jgi:eukaryotic-like serine/threonine-protein kinase